MYIYIHICSNKYILQSQLGWENAVLTKLPLREYL
jgi:hypothetical protein